MTEIAASDLRQPRRYVRLDTILRLRWLAALGQLAAIFIVAQGLEFDIPIIPCIAIIGLSALVNLALQIAFNPMQRLEPVYAAALLALNIVELAALLFFTGGLENPFSFMFLAPVLISATALPVRLTIALGFLAVACASALVFFHFPLPWDAEDPLVLPPIYLFGVWLSILLAIGVTSLYAFQVTEEARQLSDALAATELVLAREQHLTQLDGLAVRSDEIVDADRGDGGTASRFRRCNKGAACCRSHTRAGRRPQSRDPLRRRQHPGKRRRLRPSGRRSERMVERGNRRDHHIRRRPRHCPRHAETDRGTLFIAAAQRG